jgi:hypothetical protein
VEQAAGDVAESGMGQFLRAASAAATREEQQAAILSAIKAAASYVDEGAAFDREAENSAMISESAENQAWPITTIGLNFGMQECAQGGCG